MNQDADDSMVLSPPSTSRTRKKRGLSLRSQLFNRSILNQAQSINNGSRTEPSSIRHEVDVGDDSGTMNVAGGDGGVNIELGNLSEGGEHYVVPEVKVTESIDKETRKIDNNSYERSRSLSDSHLEIGRVDSGTSQESTGYASSTTSFVTRRRRNRQNRFLRKLKKVKDRVFGINDLPPSENGRVIPLTLNYNMVNEYFSQELYDSSEKSLIDERSDEAYCSNSIRSSKYTLYSFFPKQLKAQFSKIANCYFMIVAIMQMIPTWSTTGHYTTIIPLMIFISISMAREAFDDWKRHAHDKEENTKTTRVIREVERYNSFDAHSINSMITETIEIEDSHLNVRNRSSSCSSQSSDGEAPFNDSNLMSKYNLKEYITEWKNVQVGDIVKIHEDEWVPADMVLLASSNENQETFIETMALDGETNLKSKWPHPELSKKASKIPDIRDLKTLITVEDPNIDLYNFEGQFSINGTSYALGPDNIVYRGSLLRNTRYALGVVVFTGEETKSRMNNIKSPRTKAPKLQKNINYIVIFMVCVVILLSAFSTMAQRILHKQTKEKAWYLYAQDAGVAATLMGFIIMYNTLIPLSLYVTMEIIKVMQLCFLQFDIDMYHVESNTPADAKTATILEELGQVSYIFTDKTGTLTDNLMIFRKFSICGVSWIHDLDLMLKERDNIDSDTFQNILSSGQDKSETNNGYGINDEYTSSPRPSMSSLVRTSADIQTVRSATTWKSTAHPAKSQELVNSLELLRHVQQNPQTIFSRKVKFFFLAIALCNTCSPRRKHQKNDGKNISNVTLDEFSEEVTDEDLNYQSASPDELALINAARDLGFVMFERHSNLVTLKTYPDGFHASPKFEEYEVLDVIEFSSTRKRMSVVVKFPDGRLSLMSKGADNIMLEKLRNCEMAISKAKEISLMSVDRKTMEADIVLRNRLSGEMESRKSMSSLRQSFTAGDTIDRINSIDNFLMGSEETELSQIESKARRSLHLNQQKKYSLDRETGDSKETYAEGKGKHSEIKKVIPGDKLLLNDEFCIEKTLEHIEEFSTEGLRTLLFCHKWLDKQEYEKWSKKYTEAKIALVDRAKKVEETGGLIENNLELLGATAIEDKLQEGVSESIDKLRRAGIKMWMLTGDKRETAINIGYSCRLIKDYSTVVILTIDEGIEMITQRITSTSMEIQSGRLAHSVLVIDGATLSQVESDPTLLSLFLELCVQVDSIICCRASPSQKANMVSAIRNLNQKSVTLAIGDGANDIAMIQSADIGVGITGKEGLQAARSADYAIAQFRFLLKLLLVNGRYNYVRTSKFVLCTFYKELLFYLTQAVYQRNTLFSGSSLYESWSLSMFNTLFTSLPVLCVGMFDKDLKPATLIAVPELYAKGRLYQAFNLKVFISWMVLAAAQSVGISFIAYYVWGFTALRDNSVLPLGTMIFAALAVIINAKCEFIEMQNRQWLSFAAFIISVGGYGLWNILIMFLYRSQDATIFFVPYGLLEWGHDQSWWAMLLVLIMVPILVDVLIKIFVFMFKPSDDELFKIFEKDIDMRRSFEEIAYPQLCQGWNFPKEPSTTKVGLKKLIFKVLRKEVNWSQKHEVGILQRSSSYRKRAGTDPNPHELPPSGDGNALYGEGTKDDYDECYEILPSGKKVKRSNTDSWFDLGKRLRKRDNNTEANNEEDVNAIIDERLKNLKREEEGERNVY